MPEEFSGSVYAHQPQRTREAFSAADPADSLGGEGAVARNSSTESDWAFGRRGQRLCERVTFGITAFERPRHLEMLVASIRARYPRARILVADNGRQKARLPADVQVFDLPFDCGLSAARNFLVDRTTTEFFLLLEEDFQFIDETQIELLQEVLEHDPEVGVAGGSLYSNGVKQHYAVDFHRFRNTLHIEPSRGPVRATPSGVAYQICDMCFNFALFRKTMLDEHRWNAELKLGEHYPYFEAVKAQARWRVANCDLVRAEHNVEGRSEEYCKYRSRARAMYLGHLKKSGIDRVQSNPLINLRQTPEVEADKPNVVILGVGHSGTSILAKLMFALGWQPVDADDEYGESVRVRELNDRFLRTGDFDDEQAYELMQRPGPWAIKDPRLVLALPRWLSVFARMNRPPLLLWIQRNTARVTHSYVRRGEMLGGNPAQRVAARVRQARRHFEHWPWQKAAVHYEDLLQAAALVRPTQHGTTAAELLSGRSLSLVDIARHAKPQAE